MSSDGRTLQAVQATIDGGSAILARGISGSNHSGAKNDASWRRQVEMLSGLDSISTRATSEDSVSTASSLHMQIMLLRYRVSKKLLLWEVFNGVIPVLHTDTRCGNC